MPNRLRARQRAFTLLEVMIALAIFSIVLMAMVPLFATASWGTRGGRDITTGQVLARTYVDKLRNTPFGNLGPCDPANPSNAAATCAPPTNEVTANAPFVVRWTITAVNGTAYPYAAPTEPKMKRITVTVTKACSDCPNQQRRIQMTTIVSERS